MLKGRLMIAVFFALLLLSACGEQTAGVTWTEVDVPSFDWYHAAGIAEGSDTADVDISKLRFDINADPDYTYYPMAWLDENTVLCMKTKRDLFDPDSLVAITLDGEETVLENNLEESMLAQVQSNSVEYAPCHSMVLQDGITFTTWDQENKTLNPVYHFQDGYVMAAFAWTPPNLPAPNWRIRIVDMATGDIRDLDPPQWEADAESKILFSCWIDNNTLSVTESDGLTAEANCISWTCTF